MLLWGTSWVTTVRVIALWAMAVRDIPVQNSTGWHFTAWVTAMWTRWGTPRAGHGPAEHARGHAPSAPAAPPTPGGFAAELLPLPGAPRNRERGRPAWPCPPGGPGRTAPAAPPPPARSLPAEPAPLRRVPVAAGARRRSGIFTSGGTVMGGTVMGGAALSGALWLGLLWAGSGAAGSCSGKCCEGRDAACVGEGWRDRGGYGTCYCDGGCRRVGDCCHDHGQACPGRCIRPGAGRVGLGCSPGRTHREWSGWGDRRSADPLAPATLSPGIGSCLPDGALRAAGFPGFGDGACSKGLSCEGLYKVKSCPVSPAWG